MDFLEGCDREARTRGQLEQLQERRNQLEKKLNDLYSQQQRIERSLSEEPASEDVDTLEMFVTQQLLQAYRLHGISFMHDPQVSGSGLHIRFDPLYGNSFPSEEFYTVQLRQHRGSYVLGQYSLPPFVPVAALAEQYLGGDIRGFVRQIWEHVYSYVQRRENLTCVKNDFNSYIRGEVETNLPVTFVNFCIEACPSRPAIHLSLHYHQDDLLPHDVTMETVQEDEASRKIDTKDVEKVLSQGKQLLMNSPLHTAITSLIKLLVKGKGKNDRKKVHQTSKSKA